LKKSNKTKSIWGTIAAGALLLSGKLKFLLIFVKLLKIPTLISMAIYLGIYGLIFGWKFAIAIVYLIFIHEMGHLYAAKKLKLPTTPAIFIPFLGAAIGMKEMPKNAKDEAFIAYMGPVFGLLAFLPAIPLYYLTNEPFWGLVIFLGGLLNLFNLIPITPLDGGRIAAGISTKLWGLGLAILLTYSILHVNILGFYIVVIGCIQWYSIFKKQRTLKKEKEEILFLENVSQTIKRHVENKQMEYALDYYEKMKEEIGTTDVGKIIRQLDKLKYNEPTEETKQEVFEEMLHALNQKINEMKHEVEKHDGYYKTSNKTKSSLLAIYLGLALVLGASAYYGDHILKNSPEIQQQLNR
jgi:Zn-dependent protease